MGFFRARQIPTTSYGYTPPPDAVALGWNCLNLEHCGTGGDGAPRRWPFACPKCGAATDPRFAAPWSHDARGVELRHQIETNVQDGGFAREEWPVWCHRDALMRGDAPAAARARAEYRDLATRQQADNGGWWYPSGFYSLITDSIGVGDLDAAAEDLTFWLASVDSTDVENNNGRRANCRNAVDVTHAFLSAKGGPQHRLADTIRQQALDIAAGSYQVLNRDQQAYVNQFSRQR